MISIPIKFQLLGRTWTVQFVDKIDAKGKVLGETDGDDCVITLKQGLKPETLAHTFYHELAHAICFSLGWEKLNEDEGKIDALGSALFQYLKTKKGRISDPSTNTP